MIDFSFCKDYNHPGEEHGMFPEKKRTAERMRNAARKKKEQI